MRTEEARPVRLEDYRPPDWLVETVKLDVALHASATRVRAVLRLKPNPQAAAAAPLVLDGDGLASSCRSSSTVPRVPPDHYVATPDKLTIPQPPNRAVRTGDRDRARSRRQ